MPLEARISSWSPDGCELSLGSLNGIRDHTGLWIYDRTKKEPAKLLPGHFGGASWSRDRKRLLIRLSPMFGEAWIADLDPNLSTAESLKPVQTFQQHCQECIVTYTRDLEAAPDAFVSHWARATAALWIGDPQAADYLQELDHTPLKQSSRYVHAAQDILLHPALYQRLAPLAWVLARRAVEQQPGYANDLAPAFERQGQYEHAARLRQMAQTGPR